MARDVVEEQERGTTFDFEACKKRESVGCEPFDHKNLGLLSNA